MDSRRLDSEDGTPGTFSLGVSRYKTNEKKLKLCGKRKKNKKTNKIFAVRDKSFEVSA